MYKILIVEDDPVIAEAVKRALTTWGYRAQIVRDFRRVMEEFEAFEAQLTLMDISLPFFNGYHWCAEIRKRSKSPVIFLSSASDNMNVLMALNMGGDDFIAKPFDLDVLIAKVQAMLRRTYDFAQAPQQLTQGDVTLNLSDASLDVAGERIDLTKNEFRILELLMTHRGAVVPRDQIMERLWETDSYIDDNTLTVNVARLRKKLEGAGLDAFILTKKGMGYMVP